MFKKLLQSLFGKTADFRDLIKNGAVIIDVRSASEYQSGHIKNSLNIPLETIKSQIGKIKQKNKTVITVCRSGNRSGIARQMLASQGIEVYNGGAWNQLEKKLTQP